MDSLTLFLMASVILLVVPGPAVIYIVTRSIDQGRLAGFISTLGIQVGTLVHMLAAVCGVSAILMTSAMAFNAVKYLGAAYLIFLGIQKLLEKEPSPEVKKIEPKKLKSTFYEGILVNVLNPKTALFFFAFLPQFIDPSEGSAVIQILFLGFIFIFMALISDGFYALMAATLGHWLKQNAHFLRLQRYLTASTYILLGLVTAFSGSGKTDRSTVKIV